jgi:site-specific DNA recombinase
MLISTFEKEGGLRMNTIDQRTQRTSSQESTGLEGFVRLHPHKRNAQDPSQRRSSAVVLLRVSSQRQLNTAADVDSDGNSIATQREWAERKASELGVAIIKEFVEPGQSAQSIANRPIFRHMLEFVRQNADSVGYVIIYSRSRAFRNIYDANDVEKEFHALGVDLVSATEDFGSDPDQAAFMKQITDGVNHYHVRVNGRDVAKKMLHKVEKGGSVGRAKLGYVNDRKEVEGRLVTTVSIDPERAPMVRWAFEAYATGEYTMSELREAVSDQGLTTRPTRRWPQQPVSLSQLANVMRDPYYAGVIRYKGELYNGRHQTIISKELFLRVQAILDERAQRGQRDVYHHHWAKGVIWCARCKKQGRASRLILSKARGNGGVYDYFICRGRQQRFCDLPSLPVSEVETQLGTLFDGLPVSDELIEKMSVEIERALSEAQLLEQEMQSNFRSALRQLDIKEERLLDLAVEVDVATLRLGERLKKIQSERVNLEERLSRSEDGLADGARMAKAYAELLKRPGELYARADDSSRRALVDVFFSDICLDSDEPPRADHSRPVREVLSAAQSIASESTLRIKKARLAPRNLEQSEAKEEQVPSFASGLSKPTLAGVPGLEPRTKESESSVLPITPHPIGPPKRTEK